MRRDQLEHAIRAACQIIGHPAVIIIGSQAILGSYREDELPPEATMSIEVDVLPIADGNEVSAALADRIEGVAGEWSPFEELHGFSIAGVDLGTAVLPAGWHDRLVRVQNANTAAPSGRPQFIGWCLNPEDLCVAKLCARRDKDLNFVRALRDAGLVDAVGDVTANLSPGSGGASRHSTPQRRRGSPEPAAMTQLPTERWLATSRNSGSRRGQYAPRALDAIAAYRGADLTSLSGALTGYATIAQSRWAVGGRTAAPPHLFRLRCHVLRSLR